MTENNNNHWLLFSNCQTWVDFTPATGLQAAAAQKLSLSPHNNCDSTDQKLFFLWLIHNYYFFVNHKNKDPSTSKLHFTFESFDKKQKRVLL